VQIARILRERVIAGTWELGARFPSENDVAGEFETTRDTAAQALRMLRDEGLIVTRRGFGSYLARDVVRREIALRDGDVVMARMPAPGERAGLQLAAGVPLLEITRADGRVEMHGAAALIARVICEH
jgi:GntR family transcriptional regulator